MKLTGSMCQCSGCGEVFSSESGFNKHRVGKFGVDRRCLAPEDIETLGYTRTPRGWSKPMPEETRAALKALQG